MTRDIEIDDKLNRIQDAAEFAHTMVDDMLNGYFMKDAKHHTANDASLLIYGYRATQVRVHIMADYLDRLAQAIDELREIISK